MFLTEESEYGYAGLSRAIIIKITILSDDLDEEFKRRFKVAVKGRFDRREVGLTARAFGKPVGMKNELVETRHGAY
jgi:hypothetical protein